MAGAARTSPPESPLQSQLESQLELKIDQLYQQPPDSFTSARNALAKSLAAAGAKVDAARVKALAKPTVIPWAVNQVYWQAPSIWTRLLEAGDDLRAAQVDALERPGATIAQANKVRDRLRDATAAHRQAVADAVHQAVRAAAQVKANPHGDQLARMLDALSLAPASDRPGRLTEVVQPAGFEALLGVSPAPAPIRPRRPDQPPTFPATDRGAQGTRGETKALSAKAARSARGVLGTKTATATTAARPAPAPRREAAAEAAAARQRVADFQAATSALADARDAERAAEASAAEARSALEDAELRVTQARAALKTAEANAKTATAARTAAEAKLRRLDDYA